MFTSSTQGAGGGGGEGPLTIVSHLSVIDFLETSARKQGRLSEKAEDAIKRDECIETKVIKRMIIDREQKNENKDHNTVRTAEVSRDYRKRA